MIYRISQRVYRRKHMSYIDEDEGYFETMLSDKAKLKLIREAFATPQLDLMQNTVFASVTGINYKTINSWSESSRETKGKLQERTKAKICTALNLKYEVWTDEINRNDEDIFIEKLNDYREITELPASEKNTLDKSVLGEVVRMSAEEEDIIAFYVQDDVIKIPGNLETYSPDFMFMLVQLLKNKNQALDALKVLATLEETTQSFKYIHRKQIAHLRAILLSHRTVQQWDEAIETLRYLYVDGYHLEDPEIITLAASNHKRKALYHTNGSLNYPTQVDLSQLGAASTLYHEAYKLKSIEERYYDAINIAYLERILDALEIGEDGSSVQRSLDKLYKEVYKKSSWEIDPSNWWETTSKMEFLLLIGRDGEAEDLLESSPTPKAFEIDATIRQLELYTQYVSDDLTSSFLSLLRDKFLTD